ncbi:hypothetical protein H8A97_42190 [Bradyrhizobium sp. Arg62]|uniref:hypothetical protein n=1 Tax=Bradyrhizobium brasilense TaxID=1419277 RepID=UPI001E43D7E1|nr:hypothetical protein [Bradyrhizobium brasilense]MCC8951469.1 hypothetical protein [Bradyrhizobium brasilense]
MFTTAATARTDASAAARAATTHAAPATLAHALRRCEADACQQHGRRQQKFALHHLALHYRFLLQFGGYPDREAGADGWHAPRRGRVPTKPASDATQRYARLAGELGENSGAARTVPRRRRDATFRAKGTPHVHLEFILSQRPDVWSRFRNRWPRFPVFNRSVRSSS